MSDCLLTTSLSGDSVTSMLLVILLIRPSLLGILFQTVSAFFFVILRLKSPAGAERRSRRWKSRSAAPERFPTRGKGMRDWRLEGEGDD